MEPAYIKTSFVGLPAMSEVAGEAGPLTFALSTVSIDKGDTDSTASGGLCEDRDGGGDTAAGISKDESYHGNAAIVDGNSWNGWQPMPPQNFQSVGYYGECAWPYSYGMHEMYMGGGYYGGDMSSSKDCYHSWDATAQIEGSPPPPPSETSMVCCAEQGSFLAPPPGLPVTSLDLKHLQHVDSPLGVTSPALTSVVSMTAGASSATSLAERTVELSEGVSHSALDPFSATHVDEQLRPLQQVALARAISTPMSKCAEGTSLCAPSSVPSLARSKSSPAGPLPPQPPTITQSSCKETGVSRVRWNVDARKLKVKDKVAVSPSFEFNDDIPGTFRMMLLPTAVSERKGGASFKKAKGKGSVHVKCESSLDDVHDRILAITFSLRGLNEDDSHCTDDVPRQLTAPRGPVMHNFKDSGMCSLPKDQEEWDFGKATDDETQSFVVLLEIQASAPRAS
eukprot:TRINITY_DN69630_c0_g1_i1.p1 TRINITY_DN69630_c0_g1~~TRINITY_DN69630_c0_g1_i1.p1  ORF type:complete len:452 (+),score=60.57 TRINITY_DN69630_c0_g1_i1:72-1427(+)